MNDRKVNTGASICMLIMIALFFTILFACNHLSRIQGDVLFAMISLVTCLAAIFLAIEWWKDKKFDIVRADCLCVTCYTVTFALVMWMMSVAPEVKEHWNWTRTIMLYAYTLGGAIMIVGWFGDLAQGYRERKKAKPQ